MIFCFKQLNNDLTVEDTKPSSLAYSHSQTGNLNLPPQYPWTNTHLHTLTHTFTERVFPCMFNGCTLHPLRILPVKASVTVEQHSH